MRPAIERGPATRPPMAGRSSLGGAACGLTYEGLLGDALAAEDRRRALARRAPVHPDRRAPPARLRETAGDPV